MKLTGKSKEMFEEWYKDKSKYDFSMNYIDLVSKIRPVAFNPKWVMDAFDCSPNSMQYGVLVDFFDSVGIDLRIHRNQHGFFSSVNDKTTYKGKGTIRGEETRPQAREKAITKAVEILNSRK